MLSLKPLNHSARLGWSHSRYDCFASCKRKYYYQYYAKWDKDYPTEKIWRLRKLTSVPLTTGDVVHKTIEELLLRLIKTEIEIDRKRLGEFVAAMIDKDVANHTFFEVYYGKVLSVDKEEIFAKASKCLDNFLSSPRFEWLLSEGVRHKENWIVEPPHYGETVIEGVKAYAKFDFLYRDGSQILIFDWKTGKDDGIKHVNQLRAYSYWASYHLGADPAVITPIIAYLYPEYAEVECAFDESHYHDFAERVAQQSAEMQSYCRDPAANEPMSKEHFPKNDFTGLCNYCNFKELCWPENR